MKNSLAWDSLSLRRLLTRWAALWRRGFLGAVGVSVSPPIGPAFLAFGVTSKDNPPLGASTLCLPRLVGLSLASLEVSDLGMDGGMFFGMGYVVLKLGVGAVF